MNALRKEIVTVYALALLQMLTQFWLARILISRLGDREFGTLQIIIGTVNFCALGVGWLTAGISRRLMIGKSSRDVHQLTMTYNFSLVIYASYGLIAGIVVAAIAYFLNSEAFGRRLVDAFGIILYSYAYFRFSIERMAYTVLNKQHIINSVEIFGQILLAGIIWLLIFRFECTASYFFGLSLVLLVQVVISKHYLLGTGLIRKSINRPLRIFKRLKYYMNSRAVWAQAFSVFGLLNASDMIILGYIFGAGTATQYFIYWKLPEYAVVVLSKYIGVVVPKVMQTLREHGNAEKEFYSHQAFVVIYSLIFAISYAIFGKSFVEVWLNRVVEGSIIVYVIASAALFLSLLTRLSISLIYVNGDHSALSRVTVGELIFKYAFLYMFHDQMGVASIMIGSICFNLIIGIPCLSRLAKCALRRFS